MVITIFAEDWIKDVGWFYYKEIIIFMRSFHDKDLHRVHGHEHKCSGSTPTSSMHFFSITSTS